MLISTSQVCHMSLGIVRDDKMHKYRGVPASESSDPKPIFQFAPLPTTHYVILHHYNDIHNQRLIIHGVNYIHAIKRDHDHDHDHVITYSCFDHANDGYVSAAVDSKLRYCGCGFETTALSDYHTAEHKRASNLGGKP